MKVPQPHHTMVVPGSRSHGPNPQTWRKPEPERLLLEKRAMRPAIPRIRRLHAGHHSCGGGSDSTAPSSGGSTDQPLTGLVKVNVRDFSFTPATVTIKAGATVMWT